MFYPSLTGGVQTSAAIDALFIMINAALYQHINSQLCDGYKLLRDNFIRLLNS